MTIELNHTIVPAHDPKASAQFLADILGLQVDPPVARFTPVTLGNRASLDYLQQETFEPHHYAFLMSDAEFDAAFARLLAADVTYFGDPACQQVGHIYRKRGNRGTYFRDPDGHLMEILTPAA
jgi:catechol 2,3-dioxygenase-like lactoylglutathione lyase family enzyme